MANLHVLADQRLAAALADEHGRSAELVVHDGPLRQTVIGLREGVQLGEHNSPPAASIQVLRGRVRVEMGDDVQGEMAAGELWVLTHERHSVLALTDAVFLLTTVTGTGEPSHG